MSEGKHDVKTHQKAEEPKPKKKRSPLKILLILVIVLAAAVGGGTAYMYKTTKDSLDLKFTEEAPSVEFGVDYSSADYIKESTGDVAPEAASLDTDSLGAKTISYTVSQPILGGLFTPSKEFALNYEVVDTV